MPPTNNDFTPNSVWASKDPTSGQEEELTLPSGQTCRARKIGMEGLLQAGLINEADSLTSLVDKKHIRKVKGANGKADGEELDSQSLVKDPKALGSLIEMAERALPLIVVSPRVTSAKDEQGVLIPIEDRDPSLVYTDQIDMLDKFELFGWAMGDMAGLENFRGKQPTGHVAGVVDGPRVQNKAKRPARRR